MKVREMMSAREWAAQGRGADVSQLANCNIRVYGRPVIDASHEVAEYELGLREDVAEAERATEVMHERIADAKDAFFTDRLRRAELLWLGERLEPTFCGCGCDSSHVLWGWEPTLDRVRERRVTQQVEFDVTAKQVAHESTNAQVLVLDDPDEMLPEEEIYAHAWDLCDAMGY